MVNNPLTFDPRYLAQLEQLRIESRKKFFGSRQGSHLSLKKGHGLEFSDYRHYEPGDNPRYIDWKAYGRTDKLYIKQFQEDQDMQISIFLDSSASMGAKTDPEKWDLACRIALSFCYLGLMQQDQVALSFLGEKNPAVFSGSRSFPDFLRRVSEPPEISNIAFGQALRAAAMRLKFPGVAIVISDFFCDFQELELGFRQLRSRNLEIVALQVLGKKDLNPINENDFSQLIDAETGEIFDLEFDPQRAIELRNLISSHSKKLQQYFRQRQTGFTTFQSGQDIMSTLRRSQQALRVIR